MELLLDTIHPEVPLPQSKHNTSTNKTPLFSIDMGKRELEEKLMNLVKKQNKRTYERRKTQRGKGTNLVVGKT